MVVGSAAPAAAALEMKTQFPTFGIEIVSSPFDRVALTAKMYRIFEPQFFPTKSSSSSSSSFIYWLQQEAAFVQFTSFQSNLWDYIGERDLPQEITSFLVGILQLDPGIEKTLFPIISKIKTKRASSQKPVLLVILIMMDL
jgi:hypothetical protein